MGGKRKPIPAAMWWRMLGDCFENICLEFIARAKKADQRENGHDCGHRFEITVRSSGHSGIADEGPASHMDADHFYGMKPMTVRAHNLRDALLIAAARPFADWFEKQEND